MATLRKRGRQGVFRVSFRYDGKHYDRSLHTTDQQEAEYAHHGILRVLHRLRTRSDQIPRGVDPGEFIVSGGQVRAPSAPEPVDVLINDCKADYLAHLVDRIAESYRRSQQTHLGHLAKFLADHGVTHCGEITPEHLESYLQTRLGERHPNTVVRERNTLKQFFAWCEDRGHVKVSPAKNLGWIKPDVLQDRFLTSAEIGAIVARGGLSDEEVREQCPVSDQLINRRTRLEGRVELQQRLGPQQTVFNLFLHGGIDALVRNANETPRIGGVVFDQLAVEVKYIHWEDPWIRKTRLIHTKDLAR